MQKFILAVFISALALTNAQSADPEQQETQTSTTAQAFVEELYSHYKGNSTSGATGVGNKYDDYLTPSLAKLIASENADFPCMDADPFVFAQDWEIADFDIKVAEHGKHATAKVSFSNQDEAETITLKLVKLSAGWRVDDAYRNAETEDLRQMLSSCEASQ